MAELILLGVIFLIGIYSVKKYRSNMKHGCCGSGDLKIKVSDKNASHYPYTSTLVIAGMTCKNCSQRVENYLNEEGDIWATVDLKQNTALVRMKTPHTAEELTKIVQKAGYEVTAVKAQ